MTMPWDTTVRGIIDLVRDDGSDRLRGAYVTPNMFELLGVQAALGRTFVSADQEGSPAAVISHGLWRRRFGMSPQVLRRELRTRRALHLLAGAMPLAGIAAASGFADQAHLARTLRAATGATPSQLRKQVKCVQDAARATALQ